METTRHYTATVYVVNNGATLLHSHKRQDLWLPPGGHVDRDELPHEAAIREVDEETGLEIDIVSDGQSISPPSSVQRLPVPMHMQLADIDTCEGEVAHQHIDLVFYARAKNREIQPMEGEVGAGKWEWFDPSELKNDDRVDDYEVKIGQDAIETLS